MDHARPASGNFTSRWIQSQTFFPDESCEWCVKKSDPSSLTRITRTVRVWKNRKKKLHNSHALKNTHFDERSELTYFTLKNKNCKSFSNTVPLVFMYCVKTLVLLSSLKRQRFTGSGCCKIFGRSQIAVAKACQSVWSICFDLQVFPTFCYTLKNLLDYKPSCCQPASLIWFNTLRSAQEKFLLEECVCSRLYRYIHEWRRSWSWGAESAH